MKPLLKIYLCLFTSLLFIAACDDSDEEGITGFTIDTQEVTLGAIGGMEPVKVASGTKWVAKVDQPWVKVMPANGVGSTNCEIVVDSTLSNDVRHAVVTFVPEGQPKQELKIHQTGYGKMIGLDKYEVEVANMANDDKRYFDISVTTNVKFKVEYPPIGSWVTTTKREPELSLDYGALPRTIKMRFKWDMNTDPQERIASIKFLPVNAEDELEKEVTLTVKQEAAPEITDDRRGDSIAIVMASTKMRSMTSWDASERLDYWLGVTVWERTDKGVTPEQIGRVRSVEFRLLNTKEELPVEIGKIKYLETLVIYGNTNTMLLPSSYRIGNALAGLKYLRNLTISALGITTISKTELESSRKDLITLDLSGNNFTTIPYDLTPANFPGLLNLSLTGNRRYSTITDLSTETRDNPGLCIDASSSTLKNLLKWKNLKSLSLSYNLIYGKLPTFINSYNGSPEYGVSTYTDEDIQQNDTLMSASEEVKAKLKTIPNILPNAEHFSINLNFLTGDDLPDWLLYHPRFARFDPFTLIYTQDSGKDKSGNIPGFKNEPSNLEWFYERYPKARPTLTDN
ncbi:BACON domain-containing protein [Bacteroides ovatus]|uniref:BACON domain-containing protein n=1 Tax=Bacteroides ovatus TaxID=28116 RepID=UPI003567FF31